jgi:hypothetical protein
MPINPAAPVTKTFTPDSPCPERIVILLDACVRGRREAACCRDSALLGIRIKVRVHGQADDFARKALRYGKRLAGAGGGIGRLLVQ